jgi:hypothetical protein
MSEQFHGWGAFGADSIKGNFKEFDYTPKPFDDDDIESEFHLSGFSRLLPSDRFGLAALSMLTFSRHHLLWYLW